jgi:hypothetical protein
MNRAWKSGGSGRQSAIGSSNGGVVERRMFRVVVLLALLGVPSIAKVSHTSL